METAKNDTLAYLLYQAHRILTACEYKKVVLQLPKELLSLSFSLVAALTKSHPHTHFYVLYDSLKQSCCLDLLGAEHLGHDAIIHFGKACFSSPARSNHHYIFQQPQEERLAVVKELLGSPKLVGELLRAGIGYLLVDQPYYEAVKTIIQTDQILNKTVQLLRLGNDCKEQDEYLLFGYYGTVDQQGKNIMVVCSKEVEEGATEMTLCEKVELSLKSLAKIGQKLYYLGDEERDIVTACQSKTSKRLMQRYSMISQLDNHSTFGIIVSNTGTSFFQAALQKSQAILTKHNKKTFVFMMNNLNEVKLGNFPEIQVYVIISCFNHSLFAVKDFHRLLVTPTDLEIAFQNRSFDDYLFDAKAEHYTPVQVQPAAQQAQQEEVKNQMENLQLDNVHNRQVMLQNKIQTLDYYRQRQFKGLEFAEKKEVKKMGKGKIGLAQEYTNLP